MSQTIKSFTKIFSRQWQKFKEKLSLTARFKAAFHQAHYYTDETNQFHKLCWTVNGIYRQTYSNIFTIILPKEIVFNLWHKWEVKVVSVVRKMYIFLHVFTVYGLIMNDFLYPNGSHITLLSLSGWLYNESFSSYSKAFLTSLLSILVT